MAPTERGGRGFVPGTNPADTVCVVTSASSTAAVEQARTATSRAVGLHTEYSGTGRYSADHEPKRRTWGPRHLLVTVGRGALISTYNALWPGFLKANLEIFILEGLLHDRYI